MALRLFKIILLLIGLLSGLTTKVLANEDQPKFASIIFPIRGAEYWNLKNTDSEKNTVKIKRWVENINLPVTWLIRFDGLNQEIRNIVNLNNENEIGIFLEVTEELTIQSQVKYSDGQDWYHPNRVFLSGYKTEDRIKLIDTVMEKFLKIWGFYPKTVGAWHIDSFSANYLSEKYGITGIVLCADQYATDTYQLWGSWWGVPFIPSKYNLLVPANNYETKLPILIGQWAQRDALNGYGGSVVESVFSVQANDYMLKGLGINYFESLAKSYLDNENNKFGFLQIGIENDYDLNVYGDEIQRQLAYLKSRNDVKTIKFNDFVNWYFNNFEVSPPHEIKVSNQNQSASWTMSTKERIGLIVNQSGEKIRDWRIYDSTYPEPFAENRNPFNKLAMVYPGVIDTVAQYDLNKNLDNQNWDVEKLQKWSKKWSNWNLQRFIPIILGSLIIILLLRTQISLAILIILGSLTWMIPMIRSGTLMNYGLGFWGAHGHDAIWHLSIIENLSSNFSWNNPMMVGTKLSNYHFGSDLVQTLIYKTTGINNLDLYFIIIPFSLAISIGLKIVKLMKRMLFPNETIKFALFMTYFGSGLGWIVTWIKNKEWGGETMFWSQQPISTLINPPFAWSLFLLTIFFYYFLNFVKIPNLKNLTIASLIAGLMGTMKLYAGILLIIGLGILSLSEIYQLVKNKKIKKFHILQEFPILLLTINTILINGLLILPILKLGDGSQFIWNPGWFWVSMVQDRGHFYWLEMANALQAYQSTSQWIKYGLAMMILFGIWIMGNFGIRILGLLIFKFSENNCVKNYESKLLLRLMMIMAVVGIIIPSLFIQKGTSWNTIQFMYYSLFFGGILTAISIGKLIKYRKIIFLVWLIIIGLNIPLILGNYPHYLPQRAPSRIPTEELHALDFLKKLPSGNILTYPYNSKEKIIYDEPLPLRVYESTAYVSAMTGKAVVLEDQINQEITSQPWQDRRQEIIDFFVNSDIENSNKFINKYFIKYLYLYMNQPDPVQVDNLNAVKIYDSGLVRIYQLID